MPVTATPKGRQLQIHHIAKITTLAEMTQQRRRYSNSTHYHITRLWVYGKEEGATKATCTDIYPHVRRLWGLLSAKRLEALKQTAPSTLTLEQRALEHEVAAWVGEAARWHKQAGTTWATTAEKRWETGDFSNRRYNVWPEPTLPTLSRPKPKQQSCHTRKGHCQICGELKPKAGMKGDGRDFKRICKDCRRILEL